MAPGNPSRSDPGLEQPGGELQVLRADCSPRPHQRPERAAPASFQWRAEIGFQTLGGAPVSPRAAPPRRPRRRRCSAATPPPACRRDRGQQGLEVELHRAAVSLFLSRPGPRGGRPAARVRPPGRAQDFRRRRPRPCRPSCPGAPGRAGRGRRRRAAISGVAWGPPPAGWRPGSGAARSRDRRRRPRARQAAHQGEAATSGRATSRIAVRPWTCTPGRSALSTGSPASPWPTGAPAAAACRRSSGSPAGRWVGSPPARRGERRAQDLGSPPSPRAGSSRKRMARSNAGASGRAGSSRKAAKRARTPSMRSMIPSSRRPVGVGHGAHDRRVSSLELEEAPDGLRMASESSRAGGDAARGTCARRC